HLDPAEAQSESRVEPDQADIRQVDVESCALLRLVEAKRKSRAHREHQRRNEGVKGQRMMRDAIGEPLEAWQQIILLDREAIGEDTAWTAVEVVDFRVMLRVVMEPEAEGRQVEQRADVPHRLVRPFRAEKGVVPAIMLEDCDAHIKADAADGPEERERV